MKKFLRTSVLLITVAAVLLFAAACDAEGGYEYSAAGDRYSPVAPGDYSHSDSEGGGSSDESGSAENGGQSFIRKQLTAAEWRDADNYEFWRSLFSQKTEQAERGMFAPYAELDRGLDTANMREITVTFGDQPIAGAKVRLYGGEQIIYEAVTDARGKAYVFGSGATSVQAESGPYSLGVPLDGQDSVQIELLGAVAKNNEIEIVFVVDTTGSMGDELKFLKKELEGVITRVVNALEAKVKLGLVFYRDKSDEYVIRSFELRDVSGSGLSEMLRALNNQSASGGGDYPEAADEALEQAVNMQWSAGSSTKLVFHVLDAPYHDTAASQNKFAASVREAARKGVRIIPIAASGLDNFGQYVMRSAALLTGGTYAFLTDDSGIGDSHEEPEVGGFTVEYLSDLMVRLIKGYHTGVMEGAVDWRLSSSVA